MPLVPKDFGGLEQVDIENPDGTTDTYWLRRELGYYLSQKHGALAGIRFYMPWGQVKDGDIEDIQDQDQVQMSIEQHDIALNKFTARIKKWSHPDPPTPKNFQRIPQDHARVLLEKIKELEEQERDKTVQDGDPLPARSAE